MASISLLCGFGMNSISECFSFGASASISSSVFRPGSTGFSLKTTGSTGNFNFQIRLAGGTFASVFLSATFYVRIDTLPDLGGTVALCNVAGNAVTLNADGTITSSFGHVTSTLAFTAGPTWHQITFDTVNTVALNTYVDGVLWINDTTASSVAVGNTANFAGTNLATTGHVIYYSDLRLYSDSTGGPPAPYFQKLLIPTAGNNAGGWTDGAGGTGDIHGSVDNVPPTGVAASTAAVKIKNATSVTAGDYVPTLQSYTAVGIPLGSTLNAIMCICNDGEEITTGTKVGSMFATSNPTTPSTRQFDYGDDTATVVGTFPTGWATHYDTPAFSAVTMTAIVLSTAPTMTVRKSTTSTRLTDVDFMGMYADYTPPPIGKVVSQLQAVKRASFF